MIRAGRFFAIIIGDGYEIHDDTVRDPEVEILTIPIRTVSLPEATRAQIKRDASAEVARLHHEATTTQRLATAAGINPPSS
jgi:hypothetical protein